MYPVPRFTPPNSFSPRGPVNRGFTVIAISLQSNHIINRCTNNMYYAECPGRSHFILLCSKISREKLDTEMDKIGENTSINYEGKRAVTVMPREAGERFSTSPGYCKLVTYSRR